MSGIAQPDATDGVPKFASPQVAPSRFWIVANPTSGGGAGEKLLRKLVSQLKGALGSGSVVEMVLKDLQELKSPTVPHAWDEGVAFVVRSNAAHQSIEIAEAICRIFIHPQVDKSVQQGPGAPYADVVVAVGGDGTLSEVINGLCKGTLGCIRSQCRPTHSDATESTILARYLPRLIYLSAGTGADFARLGYCCKQPDDVVSIVKSLLQREGGSAAGGVKSFRIDVGSVSFPRTGTRRFFVNECSVGMSCAVIMKSDAYKKSWLRNLGGTIVFFIAAIVALVQLKPIPMRLRRLPSTNQQQIGTPLQSTTSTVPCPSGKDGRIVHLTPREIRDDAEVVNQWVDFPASTIAFGNGKFFGGGMMICPHGDPTDQLLAVTAWYATFWPFVLRLYGVYSGGHAKWQSTTTLEGSRFEVDTAETAVVKQHCEMDGELGEELPAVVEFMGSILMLKPIPQQQPQRAARNS